jgi:hypothetical protein
VKLEPGKSLHGLMAEFDSTTQIVAAARRTREAGYRKIEAYTPFPIEDLNHALGLHRSLVPYIVLTGGILGALGGFALCYWTSAIAYPMNIGGRPLNSWPAFIPVTYECTILASSLSAVFGMLMLNGLPRPHHPVFNVERFHTASRDRYFLCIESSDPRFDLATTKEFLRSLHPLEVSEVADD